jgi:hypothetical protein
MLSGTELASSKRSATTTDTDISSSSPPASDTTTPLTYTPVPYDQLSALKEKPKQDKKEELAQPLPYSSNLEKILISSQLHNDDPAKLAEGIVTEFNRGYSDEDMEKVFTLSTFRGERVQQGEFLLVVRNSKAYIATFNRQMVALTINVNPTISLARTGKFKLSDHNYFGAYGTHVLNVPIGKYAVAIHNNKPAIFDEGVHVIRDPNFKFDVKNGFINQNQDYIQHQTIHILRVKFGDIAKVTVNSTPLLLEPDEKPYVFVTPNFKYHGCEPASKNIIIHSSVKRVMPKNGEVAITNNGGTLEIIKPSTTPRIITSPTHEVIAFLPTNRQTLLLPTEKTKKERTEEKRGDLEINLEIFRTSDSLEVGFKILVIYEISDPEKVLRNFSVDTIVRHIEHTAVVDMGKAIQGHSSGDFLASSGAIRATGIENETKDATQPPAPSAPILQSLQDEVMKSLSHDLQLVGIKLIRVNVELPTIIDKKIAEQMGQQSLTTAEVNARQSTLGQELVIARNEAQREGQVAGIKVDQENSVKLKEAKNKTDVATEEAKALGIATKAQYDALEKMAQLYAKYPFMLELEKAKILGGALQNAQLTITPGQFQTFLGAATNNPFGLFKPASVATTSGYELEHEVGEQTLDGSQEELSTTTVSTPSATK